MNCPACGGTCAQELYEGVTIDVCEKCKGVWLDQGELKQIMTLRKKVFKPSEVEAVNRLCGVNGVPKQEEARKLSCPKCSTNPMSTQNYNYSSGVIVDRCPKGCGIWLDADELEKVQMHSELWQDKLEANRERFDNLCVQVEDEADKMIKGMEQAVEPSRFKFINSVVRGLVKFD